MTIDPLSVLFWTAAMFAGWRALEAENPGRLSITPQSSPLRWWIIVGICSGLGTLSKYTNFFQWISWALFFLLWPPARRFLRRPGPYLALLVNVLCFIPVIVW